MAYYQQQPTYTDPDADTEDYAPRSPNLDPAQFASADYSSGAPDPLPYHPQHQSFRASVSHVSPFSPTGGSLDYFGRGAGFQQGQGYQNPYAQQPLQFQPQQQQQQQQGQQYRPTVKQEQYDEYAAAAAASTKGGRAAARGKRVKDEPGFADQQEQQLDMAQDAAAGQSPSNGIEVRTKFPVARIKRIMQADEDVGKVAQVTPVAVSKALELFMIQLITKSAAQASSRGAKRVLPQHLKAAIAAEEQFDFLNEIVAKVPDAPASSSSATTGAAAGGVGKHKHENDEEEEESESEYEVKKRASTGRRKRKSGAR